MKRFLSAAALSLAGVLALAGCGTTTTDPTNSEQAESNGAEGQKDPKDLNTTIKILAPSYSDSSKADWDAITAKFNETYPNVKVELQIEGWETFSEKVQGRIQANDYPDILNDNSFSSSADAGLLYKMDDLLSQETLDNIEPALLANGEGPDGTQWAVPDIASARMLIYNTELFDQAGISEAPKTWEDMEDAARRISALGSDIKGYGMPLGHEEAQVESSLWVWGAGGSWVDGENLNANTPAVVEGFAQMKKMHAEGLTQDNLEDNRQDTTNLFSAGNLGMVVGHGQIVSDATAKGVQVALAPVPSKDGEGVATGVTDFIVAFDNKDADRKQATAAYLELFYSDELYEPWYKGTTLLPVTKTGIEKAKAEADEHNKAFLDALSIVKFQPVGNPEWDALQSALQGAAFQIGTQDPETLLQQIQAQVEAQR